ncbi:MAG: EAL domain-containing protein [Micrococcales bacterium]|nr:EAL domain-containing protein [Micrococcales bacterium]MCL2666417.1 EAL domain-containing protein [Micrococcales bacterium]
MDPARVASSRVATEPSEPGAPVPHLSHVPTQRPPVARQPIWTTAGALVGHEYLYRSRVGRPAGVDLWRAERQDVASASVLRSVFEESAADAEGPLIFVNVTRSFLVRDRPLPAHMGRLVLEIVESVPGDPGVVLGLRRLRARGYRVAIDDFTASAEQMPMLPYADFVKVDCRDLVKPDGLRLVEIGRTHDATLIAERVETTELVEMCVRAGFDLLQGDALGPAVTMPHLSTMPT